LERGRKTKFISYKEDCRWVGWLADYPDCRTQGESLSELKDNLDDIYHELTSENIPGLRKVGELVLK
jgi:predicted RNase H-like HicB family nuclease